MKPPDFIIVGAMKCATSTLHEQLSAQPGIFMTTPKEPYFFSNDEVYAKGIDWYRSLFSESGVDDLRGESSTHYTKLPTYPMTVERMFKHAPAAKLIYIMRHPIDRLVSQYMHEWRVRMISEPIETAIDNFSILTDYSRYSMQLKPHIEAFGVENILPVFFDHLRTHPQDALERATRFIGYTGSPNWNTELDAQNIGGDGMKSSPLRDAVVFAPGLSAVRRRLVPKAVRNSIKKFWQIRDRPQLPDDVEKRLEDIFDADLAQLGSLLGLALTCDNFKELTQHRALEWKTAARREI